MATADTAAALEWAPSARQQKALARTEYELLYGGARYGGKTEFLLAWTILRRLKFPQSRGLFVRREISEVIKQGAAWDRAHELLGAAVKYVSTPQHLITFPNGSVLEFGHCQHEDDVRHYLGAQYDDICYDQLEQFSEGMYLQINGSCRTPQGNPPRDAAGNAIQPRIRSSANPGGSGHSFVKARFVSSGPPEEPRRYTIEIREPAALTGAAGTAAAPVLLKIERDRIFIPSRLFDNPYASPEYAATLYDLPEHLQKAYLWGDWDVFVGQAFADFHPITEAGEPYHVIPQAPLPAAWVRFGGHDWGFQHVCYVCWGAIDPAGGIVIYRELAVRGWDPGEIARNVKALEGQEHILAYYAGHDVFQTYKARLSQQQMQALDEKGLLQLSLADQYRSAGWSNVFPVLNDDRIAGVQRLHGLLKDRGDGVPWLRIMRSCPVLIETLEQIRVSATRTEDVEKTVRPDERITDDPYDTIRYLCMSVDLAGKTGKVTEMPTAKW